MGSLGAGAVIAESHPVNAEREEVPDGAAMPLGSGWKVRLLAQGEHWNEVHGTVCAVCAKASAQAAQHSHRGRPPPVGAAGLFFVDLGTREAGYGRSSAEAFEPLLRQGWILGHHGSEFSLTFLRPRCLSHHPVREALDVVHLPLTLVAADDESTGLVAVDGPASFSLHDRQEVGDPGSARCVETRA
jgi:hypothetical protein